MDYSMLRADSFLCDKSTSILKHQLTISSLRYFMFNPLKAIIMPVRKLIEFLNKNQVKFVTISHSPAYTAMEIAESAHIPGKELAKTVMIRIDGKMAMAVVPASCMVDFELLKKAIGATNIVLASEQEFADMFPECELGAMPPFGNLYGMNVFVASALTEDEEIAFNAGSLTELIRLSYTDFDKLANPIVVKCC